MVVVNLAATSCVDPVVLDQKLFAIHRVRSLTCQELQLVRESYVARARPIKGECLVVVFIA